MSFLNRVGKVATGFGGALQAPFGLVKDLATAPFTDDETDGMLNTVYRHTVRRGGQAMGNLFGPKEGLGALAGGAPKSIRNPVGKAFGAVGNVLETAYREGVAEPVTAGLSSASLAAARGGSPITRLTSFFSNLDEGYDIAQDRSPGQALAVGVEQVFGRKGFDPRDKAQMAKLAGTDTYEIISGTTDAALRLFGDPTVLATKALHDVRLARRALLDQADVRRALGSPRFAKFNASLEGKSAAEIRDIHFPSHAHGQAVSALLADAGDAESRRHVLAALMGDQTAIASVRERSAALSNKLARALSHQDIAGRLELPGPRVAEALAAEVEELYPALARNQRLEASVNAVRERPNYGLTGRFREGVVHTDYYHSGALAAPLRVVHNMRPHRFVNLHDASGDIQVRRMLRQSALDVEAQDALASRYISALTPGERQAAVIAAEEASVRSLAEKAGMTVEEVQEVMTRAAHGRHQAAKVLKGRAYDGEGRSLLRTDMDDGVQDLPLMVSQEANMLPLADMREVRRATTRIAKWKADHPVASRVAPDLLEGFYRVWRPAVLLRVGWPIRVVGDEQMRMLSKIGALTQVKAGATEAFHRLDDVARRVPKDERIARRTGLKVGNYEMQGAFGAPGDADNVWKAAVSSRASFEGITGQTEAKLLNELRRRSGEWTSVSPESESYSAAWEHAVNLQIGQDAMARKFLAGESVDDAVRWMRTDPAGQAYAGRLSFRRSNLRAWAESLSEQVEAYTVGHPDIKAAALGRKATAEMLAKAQPNPSLRPLVQGEILAQATGTSVVMQLLNRTVEGAYKTLGQIPTDRLSRQRYFRYTYEAEVKRQVGLLDDGALTEDALRQIENSSRTHALHETKHLLYDLAEQSELGEMLRFVAPFFAAWQEQITRWAGIAIDNPGHIRRMQLALNSPDKAGAVVDKYLGISAEEVEGDKYVLMRIPDWAKDVPIFRGLRSQGQVAFNRKSFNMLLQGTPGFGPVVQIPVNEIVKGRPELEESVQFILPYGTTPDWKDMLMPATLKRLQARSGGEENRAYRNSLLRIYYDKLVDINLGKRPKPENAEALWKEAERETKAFFSLRTVASFVLPAAPSFRSPYQPYIDAYRALKEADPATADERFLSTYGEEFFPLTQSLSHSINGVPPTLEGMRAAERHEELIGKYPELGSLIVGAEGAGEFNRAVYDHQLNTRLRPGSSQRQREAYPLEEAAVAPEVRLGWMQFGKAMDLIDAEMHQRGLPNLRVKAAKDLTAIKRAIIDKLAEKYPAWSAEYNTRDDLAAKKKMDGLRDLAGRDWPGNRTDIVGLRDYLHARDLMVAELGKRAEAGGAKTLDASSNQDLAFAWDSITTALTERNLQFGALYHRWLERDRLAA